MNDLRDEFERQYAFAVRCDAELLTVCRSSIADGYDHSGYDNVYYGWKLARKNTHAIHQRIGDVEVTFSGPSVEAVAALLKVSKDANK